MSETCVRECVPSGLENRFVSHVRGGRKKKSERAPLNDNCQEKYIKDDLFFNNDSFQATNYSSSSARFVRDTPYWRHAHPGSSRSGATIAIPSESSSAVPHQHVQIVVGRTFKAINIDGILCGTGKSHYQRLGDTQLSSKKQPAAVLHHGRCS